MNTWLQTVAQEHNSCTQTAKCGIAQMHVIVIYMMEGETQIVHIGIHFIHMRNIVAEHKMTNITNKR